MPDKIESILAVSGDNPSDAVSPCAALPSPAPGGSGDIIYTTRPPFESRFGVLPVTSAVTFSKLGVTLSIDEGPIPSASIAVGIRLAGEPPEIGLTAVGDCDNLDLEIAR